MNGLRRPLPCTALQLRGVGKVDVRQQPQRGLEVAIADGRDVEVTHAVTGEDVFEHGSLQSG